MGMEQEIKLRARDGADPSLLPEDPALLPLRCSPMESIEMRTTYYDTEEHILARAKWALRCRTENGEPVITLKTPPDANHKRGEWELRGPGLVEQDEIQPGAFNACSACQRARGSSWPWIRGHFTGAAAAPPSARSSWSSSRAASPMWKRWPGG